MSAARLPLAVDRGDVTLPEVGRIAVFGPRMGTDLSVLPVNRAVLISGFKPDHDHFAGQGYSCVIAPEGRFSAAVVCVPRSKTLARAFVAQAVAVTDGPVIVDGAKTDGIEALLKACRARVEVSAPLSKAHGKLFSFDAGEAEDAFADWSAEPTEVEGRFVTRPGVFSADGIDTASKLLGDHLPPKLGAVVADLGGGWGYLGTRVLERDSVERLHLVEADHAALDCARDNLRDARAQLHWDDATRWRAPEALDSVVMNPPFHSGRAADPDLGRAFIGNAARLLKPAGQLWMVANRHLPYEAALSDLFKQVTEAAGDNRFKILHAARPSRLGR